VHNDKTDDQPIHRQRSRRQIIPSAPTRYNAIRNVGAPWCGTGPPNAQRRNIKMYCIFFLFKNVLYF